MIRGKCPCITKQRSDCIVNWFLLHPKQNYQGTNRSSNCQFLSNAPANRHPFFARVGTSRRTILPPYSSHSQLQKASQYSTLLHEGDTTVQPIGEPDLSDPVKVLEHRRRMLKKWNYDPYTNDWGFVFVRCTYSSQSEWDQYMALIKGDARQMLSGSEDETIWQDLKWTIIEDLKLDGADYVEAARRFRDWRGGDKATLASRMDPREAERCGQTVDEYCEGRIHIPRHKLFIHATKESVESVLGASNNGRDEQSTDYFVTVVSYLDVYWRVMGEHALLEGREEEDEENWELYEKQWAKGFSYAEANVDTSAYERRQNFKAYDLVALYADEDAWPKFYRDRQQGGLSYVQ